MATTSLWHIRGRLKDLIDYVNDLDKTVVQSKDLWVFLSHAQRPEATANGEYVTAINCLKETALQQMILTKQQYGSHLSYRRLWPINCLHKIPFTLICCTRGKSNDLVLRG